MKRITLFLTLCMLALLFLFPIALTVINSVMTAAELDVRFENNRADFTLIPTKVSLSQYYRVLFDQSAYLSRFWNSVLYSSIITLLGIIVAIPAAYVFAKHKFNGRGILFFQYIAVMMMPFQVTLLPNFILLRSTGLLNTRWAVILPGIFAPFPVFLMRQLIRQVPNELIEAVRLESNSVMPILGSVVVPATKAGVIALVVLLFAESWNMVEQPLIFLADPLHMPLSTVLSGMMNYARDTVFAGSIIFLLPMIVLYACFEEQIIMGLRSYRW